MKIRATSVLKLVDEQKTRLDLKPNKGESLDNVIGHLSAFSDANKWHSVYSQESTKLQDGQVVLVDSTFGVHPAVVHAYPMSKGFQDLVTGADDLGKDRDGNEFIVRGWRYLPAGMTDTPKKAVEIELADPTMNSADGQSSI